MVTISPTGLATTTLVANRVSLLATYTEKLCRSYCVGSSIKPQYNITYVTGTPELNGTTVFVPVTAVITLVTAGLRCYANTQLFTESFTVAIQGQTALPTSVTINSVGRIGGASNINCCKAKSYTIHDSLTVAIA